MRHFPVVFSLAVACALLTGLPLPEVCGASLVERDFAVAEEARQNGDLDKAYRILQGLVQRAPESVPINFTYGLTSFALGDYSRAKLAFQRVLQIEPGHHRARLELARALAETERYAEAQVELRRVLAANPPPRVRENVEAYLARLKSASRHSSPYGVHLEAGVMYDSNVNVGPNTDTILIRPIFFGPLEFNQLVVAPESKPKKDFGGYVAGRGQLEPRLGLPSGWLGDIGVYGYASEYFDEDAFSLLFYQAHAGVLYRRGSRQLRLPLRSSHIYRGGESLVQSIGMSPVFHHVMPGSGQRIALRGDLQWRDYTGRKDRDGLLLLGGAGIDQFYGQKRHLIGLAVAYYDDMADADIYAKYGVRLSLHAALNLPWHVSLQTAVHHTKEHYREQEALAPEAREDTQLQVSGGIRKRLARTMTLDLSHQYTQNRSTFNLYSHDRNVTTLGFSYSF